MYFEDPLKTQTFWTKTIGTLWKKRRHRKGEKSWESIFRLILEDRGKYVLHKGSLPKEF